MSFRLDDLDNRFYKKAIREVKNEYRDFLNNLCRFFDETYEFRTTPIIEYDPVQNKEIKFSSPIDYKIKMVYYFDRGDLGIDYDIERHIASINDLMWSNPLRLNRYENMGWDSFKHNRLGFMMHIADLKLGLFEGENFTAIELGLLTDRTGQTVINHIKNGSLNAEKTSHEWKIKNDDAREYVKEHSAEYFKEIS